MSLTEGHWVNGRTTKHKWCRWVSLVCWRQQHVQTQTGSSRTVERYNSSSIDESGSALLQRRTSEHRSEEDMQKWLTACSSSCVRSFLFIHLGFIFSLTLVLSLLFFPNFEISEVFSQETHSRKQHFHIPPQSVPHQSSLSCNCFQIVSTESMKKKKNPPPFHSSNLCFKPDNHLTVRQLKLSIIEAVIALGMLFFAVKHQHKSKWVKYACLLSHFHPTPLQYRQHVLLDASLWITCQVLMVCSDQINSLYQLPLMRMAGGIWVVCVFYCIWILNEGSYSSGSVKLSWRKAMKR